MERKNPVEAAEYLGISLSLFKKTVRKEIPVIKIGRRTQFDVKDLDAYLENKKVKA